MKLAEKSEAPALVHNDLEMTSSVLRDLISDKVEKIVVDSKDDYKKIQKMVKDDALDIGDTLEHYRKRTPLFKETGIDNSMIKLLRIRRGSKVEHILLLKELKQWLL